MGEVKEKELTKDELKNVAGQLQQQNKFLIERLEEAKAILNKDEKDEFYKRLDYLFKVIENAKLFISLDEDFVKRSASEIVAIMTPPDVEPKSDEDIKE